MAEIGVAPYLHEEDFWTKQKPNMLAIYIKLTH